MSEEFFLNKFVKTMHIESYTYLYYKDCEKTFGGKIIRQNIAHQNQGSFLFPISYQ